MKGLSSNDLDLTSKDAYKKLINISKENTILIITTRAVGPQNSDEMFRKEIAMGVNISKFLESSKVSKCIFLSTISVYDDHYSNLNITENFKVSPSSFYGQAKLKNENTISQICKKNGIGYVILRCCKMYGPNDKSYSYGPSMFIKSILMNENVCLFGDGQEIRDYLYETDLIVAIHKFLTQGNSGIYNISSGDPVSFIQILKLIENYTGKSVKIISKKRTRAKIDQKIVTEKLKKELKGISFTTISEGIHKTYERYRSL